MTHDELNAVCARHGILLSRGLHSLHWSATMPGAREVLDPDPADAVCALLKALWRIEAESSPCGSEWRARALTENGEHDELGVSELAAVVALADRLAGVTT